MHKILITCLCVSMVTVSASGAQPRSVPISDREAQAWIRYVVPLPKQISIHGQFEVPANKIAIVAPRESEPLVTQAIKELRASMGLPESAKAPRTRSFTLTLQLGGPEATDLGDLKNADQAYRILSEKSGAGLRLVALKPPGLYYAAKTLQQLIRAKANAAAVTMPMLKITDSPDMEDRGLWGADCHDHLKWLSDRKMNIVEQISNIGVDETGRGWGKHKSGREPMSTLAPTYAVKPVPVVLHLEQVSGKGVLKAYPELKAQGTEHEGAMCYSKPAIVDVLADWIVSLASLPGVHDVDVWLTENLQGKGGCQCPECKKEDRSVLEARAINAAWTKAKERVPDVGLYTLTSEETEDSNQKVFRELLPGIKIWYYHSLLTYTAGETPMLRSYLPQFAKQGRWIVVCPNLVGAIHFTEPFTGAHFIHYRMNEFAGKNMSGLIGYVTPRVYYAFFNVEAAAEWSWNARGRSPHEFALSWAVRRGIKDPAKFAEWSDTVGPVAWDVYGSDWPHGEQRENHPGQVAKRLKEGKLNELGTDLWGVYRSPWSDIKTPEHLDRDVAEADRGLKLAREMAIPEFIHESLIVQGYIRSLKALWELKQIVKPDGVARKNRKAAQRYFRMYVDSLRQVTATLPKWEATVPMRKPAEDFTAKPIKVINQAIDQMTEVARELGFNLKRP